MWLKTLLVPLSWLPWRGLGLLGIAVVLPAAYFMDFSGQAPIPDDRLTRTAAPLVSQAVAELPMPGRPSRLLLLPLHGDSTEHLRMMLHGAIAESGKYTLVKPGVLAKRLANLGLDLPTPRTVESAGMLAKTLPGDLALWGEVETWKPASSSGAEPAAMAFTLYLFDNGKPIWQRRLDLAEGSTPEGDATMPPGGLDWSGLLLRLGAWLALVLALPFLLWPVTGDLIRRRDNNANALMLGLYSLISLAGAWLLCRGLLAGAGLAVTLVLAFLAAAGLLYLLCSWMEKLFLE